MILTRQQFINKYWHFAKNATLNTGIYPEILLSQAILESQGKLPDGQYYPGQSLLAKKYQNYFGIKANAAWKGKSVVLNTGEVFDNKSVIIPDSFRVYNSFEESANDYIKFLKSNPRYSNAGVFNANSAAEQARRLQNAGYATNPNYSYLVASIADKVKEIAANIVNNSGKTAIVLLLVTTLVLITWQAENI